MSKAVSVIAAGGFVFAGLAACGSLLGADEDPSNDGNGSTADGSSPTDDGATTATGGGDGSSDAVADDVDAGTIPCGQTTCRALAEQCCWSTTGANPPACEPLGKTCPSPSVALTCAFGAGCEDAASCCVGYLDGGPLGTRCGCSQPSGVWYPLCGGKPACPLNATCVQANLYPLGYQDCQNTN